MRRLTPALLLLQAALAHAQQAAPAKDEPPVQKVEVTGRNGALDARRNDTATKIVVNEEEILKHGDTNLADVMKRLPGISNNGGGIRMRGLGNGYTQILVNGDPLPPGFSLATITPEMVERIEIMRAATAEYSAQAIAGVINIVLKQEVRRPAGAIVKPQRSFSATMQDEGGRIGGTLGFNSTEQLLGAAAGVGASLNHSLQHRETLRDDLQQSPTSTILQRTYRQQFNGKVDSMNVNARLSWTLGERDTLNSSFFASGSRVAGANRSNADVLAGVPPPTVRDLYDTKSVNGGLRGELHWIHRFAQAGRLDMKFAANANRNDSSSSSIGYDQAQRLALVIDTDYGNGEHGFTTSGKFGSTAHEGHALVFGWDGAYTKRDARRFTNEFSPTGLTPDHIDDLTEAVVRRVALFAQDEWNLTEKWSIYLGARWEGVSTQGSIRGGLSASGRYSVASPILQSLWKLPDSRNDQVRLALARTYKAPDTFALLPRRTTARENTALSPDYYGNPNLRPQLAWGLDLSYEHFMENGGTFSVGGFGRAIVDIPRSRTQLIGERWVAMTENLGKANTRGIEMDTKLPLTGLWDDAPPVEIRANLTRTWSHVDGIPGPDNRLDDQIPLSGTVGLDYRPKAKYSLGGSFSYTGPGPMRVAVAQYRYTGPRRLMDVYVNYNFDTKISGRIAVSNVLHQDTYSDNYYVYTTSVFDRFVRNPSWAVFRASLTYRL
jgi:outer membrane receptor for ferrienterochelin and colicins